MLRWLRQHHDDPGGRSYKASFTPRIFLGSFIVPRKNLMHNPLYHGEVSSDWLVPIAGHPAAMNHRGRLNRKR